MVTLGRVKPEILIRWQFFLSQEVEMWSIMSAAHSNQVFNLKVLTKQRLGSAILLLADRHR